MHFQGLWADAEQRLLGLIAVGGHPAIEPMRGAGDIGHCLGDPASGATLGSDQALARGKQLLPEGFGQLLQFGIGGKRHGHGKEGAADVLAQFVAPVCRWR